MEEIFSLPPIKDFFNDDYALVLEFMDTLGNPKFKIAGTVYLVNSDIESLGNLVEVEGYLDLCNAKKIKSLPDNLKVGGTLDLYNTKLKSLPNNLKVGGSLGLFNTNIKSLPDNLQVGGNLYLGNTLLSWMYSEKKIRKMIEDKGGYIGGYIYL